ncbi:hypothetical protein CF70_028360, partial [Cupriavidus sp. SK-3]
MQQFHPILRGLAARLIPAFVLVAVASISPKALAIIDIWAFGSTLNLPNTLPTGTVVSRYTISLSQLCGSASSCPRQFIFLWPNGGTATAPGPLIATNVSGISTRLLVNGQPVTNNTSVASVNSPLEVQLVRDSRPLVAGSLKGSATNPGYYSICPSSVCYTGDSGRGIILSATVRLVNGT